MTSNLTRRKLLKTTAAGLATFSLPRTLLARRSSQKRPNLLLVFPDQMRGQALGFMNEAISLRTSPPKTPGSSRN